VSLYGSVSAGFGRMFHTGDPENPPPLHRNPWWWGVVIMLLMPPLLHLSGITRRIPDPPEVVATLPAFDLIDQNGEAFTSADLAGRVHITGFFFTSCPTSCPRIMTRMAEIEDIVSEQAEFAGFGDDIRFLAISVDPETDTPDKLRETLVKYGLDAKRWTLLTGPKDQVVSLVQDGFKQAVGDRTETEPGVFDIAHSNKLAIVDGDGGVRGFYGLDPVSEQLSLAGARLGTDYDGPDAIRGWARVIWADQVMRERRGR